jgi:hypothetical protein
MTNQIKCSPTHTPTPWGIDNRNDGWNRHSIIDVKNESLAICQVMNDVACLYERRAMNRAQIAACDTPQQLRDLYCKHNPQSTMAKCEYFINKVFNAREKKKCKN